jgi:hypothetical protein
MDSTWSLASRRRVLRKIIEMAEGGNLDAARLLLSYSFGQPKAYHEVTGADDSPLDIEVHVVDYRVAVEALRPLGHRESVNGKAPVWELVRVGE